ncbi:Protein kinase superfamily protein [Euphorbia peplus]|nr:Protein kinase superfamily protein [Euphorbia peplus]
MSLLLLSPPSFPAALNAGNRKVAPHRTFPQPVRAVSRRNEDVDAFTLKSGYMFELSITEADTLNDYDIRRISAIYRRKPLILIRRLFQIGTSFGTWFALRYYDSLADKSDIMFKVRAAQLRQILVELGPAFVKIAQAVSSRSDLIPPSYLDELSLLQDRIAPFSSKLALNTIEKELGVPIDELFSEISPEPIAAASLGQVYQARLRQSEKLVAVKVQRPGVQAAIALDILILRYMAGVVKRIGKFNSDLQAVVDEWASSLFREMDYVKEANNGIKFRKLYGGIKDVSVPEMYIEHTTRKVLVMDWIEGQKLSEVKDIYLVEIGVYCSFNQLLEYGFYHADPHPGNFIRTDDGKLAYIDFGMMGEFKQELRDAFIEACLHLVNRDFDALAKDFVTLGFIPSTADKDAVTRTLTDVLQNSVAKGIRNISFGDLLGNLGTAMYKFKFQIPSYFFLVIRSLAVLEGIAISFDPNYKVLGSTYPWIARKVLTDSSPKLKSSLRNLLYKGGSFRIDRLESLVSESLRASTERALVKRQTEEDDSKVAIKQVLSFTLTEKGAFIREILLQEIAKGLDALAVATIDSSIMTEEDIINLRTLRRLTLLLSGSQKNASLDVEIKENNNQNTYLEAVLPGFNQLSSVREILPIISIIPELPPEIQQQFLLMPADLAGRLISRATARTIRRIFL